MRTLNKYFLFMLIPAIFLLSGCSVFMAMHGKRDADLSTLKIGQDRDIIVLNLGEPDKSYINNDERVDVYELQKGNAPSAGRALGHAAMDALTFGFWEALGTPIEGFQGKTYTVAIRYDENNKVAAVNTVHGRIKKNEQAIAQVAGSGKADMQ